MSAVHSCCHRPSEWLFVLQHVLLAPKQRRHIHFHLLVFQMSCPPRHPVSPTHSHTHTHTHTHAHTSPHTHTHAHTHTHTHTHTHAHTHTHTHTHYPHST